MKNLFILLLVVLLLSNCSDSTKSDDYEYNTIKFTVNGAEWDNETNSFESPAIANSGASYSDSVNLTCFTVFNGMETPNSLSGTIKGDTAGVYHWIKPLGRYNNYILITLEPVFSTNSLHSYEGQTTITEFPEPGKMITGSFSGRFHTFPIMIQDSLGGFHFSADTVDVSGTFEILRLEDNLFPYFY